MVRPTDARNSTDSFDILNACSGFDLDADDEGLVGRLDIGWEIYAMNEAGKRRTLATDASWRELRALHDGFRVFGSIDLGHNEPA